MRYYSFNTYLREKYGTRVHRLSLNAGFSCPTRDGTLDAGGCVFCNEKGYARFTGDVPGLEEQITLSMEAARERYKAGKFIAYFQNGSNTYADPETLREKYDVIKKFPDIVAISVSTRPDCVDNEKLDVIASYAPGREVWIEYGVQTVHDRTLRAMNRRHGFEASAEAIRQAASKGIKVGVHLIIGLPGESEADNIETMKAISGLPVSGVKFHVLHVLRDTPLEKAYNEGAIKLLDMEGYVDIISKVMGHLAGDRIVLRLVSEARKDVLVAPDWVLEKQRVIAAIGDRMEQLGIVQGQSTKEGFS